jgi:succinyl-CoA synthetase beta subunit
MKIHEYQAKQILAKYGVAVPRGEVANTLEEASAAEIGATLARVIGKDSF